MDSTMFLALSAVGLALLTQVDAAGSLVALVAGSVIISLGLAPVFGLTTELIVGSAPPERAGAASGISETGAELGGALGIAILGSIGVAIYRGELAGRLPPDVPPEAAALAGDTLGSAVAVAGELPDQLAPPFSRPLAKPLSTECNSARPSRRWWRSGSPSLPWSCCATDRLPPSKQTPTRSSTPPLRPAAGS
ncbi:MAG: hypothetical protein M3R09_10510 [Actinomycetota bacterium]|nr:hypothetical protein [Actinomycetota bacterium]